jgi:hypothetical protein
LKFELKIQSYLVKVSIKLADRIENYGIDDEIIDDVEPIKGLDLDDDIDDTMTRISIKPDTDLRMKMTKMIMNRDYSDEDEEHKEEKTKIN